MDERNYTLTISIDNLTDQECYELIEAINKIIKENNVTNCQMEFWKAK